MAPLCCDLAVEVVFVVRPQVSHSGQDDDHDQCDDGGQNDQHRLVHCTIHRGVGLGMALAAPVSAIDASADFTPSTLDSLCIS